MFEDRLGPGQEDIGIDGPNQTIHEEEKPISEERRAELRQLLERKKSELRQRIAEGYADVTLQRIREEIDNQALADKLDEIDARMEKDHEALLEAASVEPPIAATGEAEVSPEFTEAQVEHVMSVVIERTPKPEAKEQKYEQVRLGKIAKAALLKLREMGLHITDGAFQLASNQKLTASVKAGIQATLWDMESDYTVEGAADRVIRFLASKKPPVIVPDEYRQIIGEEVIINRIASRTGGRERFIKADDFMLIYAAQASLTEQLNAGNLSLPISTDAIIQAISNEPLNTQVESRGQLRPRSAAVVASQSWANSSQKEQLIIDTIAYRLAVDLPGVKYIEDDEKGPSIIQANNS